MPGPVHPQGRSGSADFLTSGTPLLSPALPTPGTKAPPPSPRPAFASSSCATRSRRAAWPRRALPWPLRASASGIVRLASLLPKKLKATYYGSVTEKHPEEEDEVECVLLSASKILNSSDRIKESGGSETGEISKAKESLGNIIREHPPAVMFLPLTTGKGYPCLNPLAQEVHSQDIGTSSNYY